jgi:hypothetical protein
VPGTGVLPIFAPLASSPDSPPESFFAAEGVARSGSIFNAYLPLCGSFLHADEHIGTPFFRKKGENEEKYAEIPVKLRKFSQKLMPLGQIGAVGLNYSALP